MVREDFKLSPCFSLIFTSFGLEAEKGKEMLLRFGLLVLSSLRKANAWAANAALLGPAESSKQATLLVILTVRVLFYIITSTTTSLKTF